MRMDFVTDSIELPLIMRPAKRMSDDDLVQFCAGTNMQVEREPNGDLRIMTPAGVRSSQKNLVLSGELYMWASRDGSGLASDSSGGFTLPDGSMRAPDAAWVERKRWEALSVEDQEGFAPICPDFVIELRSSSDRLAPLQEKMQMWISNGAQLAWLIDPQEKAVTIYRPGTVPERLENISQVSGEGPVAGFILPLDRIFAS